MVLHFSVLFFKLCFFFFDFDLIEGHLSYAFVVAVVVLIGIALFS